MTGWIVARGDVSPFGASSPSLSATWGRAGALNDELSDSTQELSQWIEVEMRSFARQLERLATIPGVRRPTV